jgi:uncharacterized protein
MKEINTKLLRDTLYIYKFKNHYFAFNKNGRGFYAISREAYDIAMNKTDNPSIEASEQLYEILDEATKNTYSEKVEVTVNSDQDISLGYLWLGIAHCCNLNCSYCFANKENYLKDGKNLMNYDTAKKAIDFLLEKRGNRTELAIIFFGGEPLLNFDIILKVMSYVREKEDQLGIKFSFGLTTNGTLLTQEKYELIKERVGIMISIDGTKELHDKYRRTKDNRPSWDQIMSNLDDMNEYKKKFDIRVTITEDTLDLVEIFKNLYARGFKNIFCSEVVPNNSSGKSFENFDIRLLKSMHEGLAEYLIDKHDPNDGIGPNTLKHLMESIYFGYNKYYCCSTGLTGLYITPTGDIYPCGRLITEDKRFKIGNIHNELFDKKIIEQIAENHIFNKNRCKKCWAKHICGGQCYCDCFESTGDIFEPSRIFCAIQKHKIKIAGYALKMQKDKGGLNGG